MVSIIPGDECLRHKFLPEADRSQTYDYRKVSGGHSICDNTLQRDWYRFVGLAGDRMPNECVPSYHCGTYAAGWLRGGHPSVHEGVVSRTVCYHWINNCCWRSNNILVRNCGGFYVYRLQKTPGCQYRYCGVGSPVEKYSSLLQLINETGVERKAKSIALQFFRILFSTSYPRH